MKDALEPRFVAKVFRVVAIAEAVTWAALLVAMVIKRVADNDDAIFVPGMVHGIVFVIYVLTTLAAAWVLRWNIKVTLWGLVASLPPFGTLVFEIWAGRRGHLRPREPSSAAV